MPVGGCFRKSIGFAGVGPLAPFLECLKGYSLGGPSHFLEFTCAIIFSRMGMYLEIMGCGYAIENTHNKHFTYQL
jgi:hypothetical protein